MVMYISPWVFVQSRSPLAYSSTHDHLPVQITCFNLSFVPSVISLCNSLPDHVKASLLSVCITLASLAIN